MYIYIIFIYSFIYLLIYLFCLNADIEVAVKYIFWVQISKYTRTYIYICIYSNPKRIEK